MQMNSLNKLWQSFLKCCESKLRKPIFSFDFFLRKCCLSLDVFFSFYHENQKNIWNTLILSRDSPMYACNSRCEKETKKKGKRKKECKNISANWYENDWTEKIPHGVDECKVKRWLFDEMLSIPYLLYGIFSLSFVLSTLPLLIGMYIV